MCQTKSGKVLKVLCSFILKRLMSNKSLIDNCILYRTNHRSITPFAKYTLHRYNIYLCNHISIVF